MSGFVNSFDSGVVPMSAFIVVVTGVIAVGVSLSKAIRAMVKDHQEDKKHAERIDIALFGREGDPVLPPIPGLLTTVDIQTEQIAKLLQAITVIPEVVATQKSMEVKQETMRADITKLVERTQPNGGSSLADKIDRIDANTGSTGQSQGSLDRIESNQWEMNEPPAG